MSDLINPFDEMETVNALINEGIEQGYITYDQILEVLPDVEKNIVLLETILEEAQSAGIVIYESEDDAQNAASLEEDELEDEEIPCRPAFRPEQRAHRRFGGALFP
jgi:hypothetical protein